MKVKLHNSFKISRLSPELDDYSLAQCIGHNTEETLKYSCLDLDGLFKFKLIVNSNRINNKRQMPRYLSLKEKFNHNVFNFNKMKENEIVMKIRPEKITTNSSSNIQSDLDYALIAINLYPVVDNHYLLIPDPHKFLTQNINRESLNLSLEICHQNEGNLIIGFNSLCGDCSVNHLHLHLFNNFPYKLPILESVKNSKKYSSYRGEFYKLRKFSSPYLCFLYTPDEHTNLSDFIVGFTEFLILKNFSYNILIAKHDSYGDGKVYLILFPRKPKFETDAFDTNFLGMSGIYVTTEANVSTMTEANILSNISKYMLSQEHIFTLTEEYISSYQK